MGAVSHRFNLIYNNNYYYLLLFINELNNSIVKSTVTYGAETWTFNKILESKLTPKEMDFLRRSARCSRLETIRNNVNSC